MVRTVRGTFPRSYFSATPEPATRCAPRQLYQKRKRDPADAPAPARTATLPASAHPVPPSPRGGSSSLVSSHSAPNIPRLATPLAAAMRISPPFLTYREARTLCDLAGTAASTRVRQSPPAPWLVSTSLLLIFHMRARV